MLAKLRAWLRGLFGGDSDAATDAESAERDATDDAVPDAGTRTGQQASAEGADDPEAALTCAICETQNPADAGECSLCGSSDLRSAEEGGSATTDGADSSDTDPSDDGLSGAGTRTERVSDDADADRLREVRSEGELLVRHRDRWERLDHDEGFRVSLPDGERVVESRDEVRELLRAVESEN